MLTSLPVTNDELSLSTTNGYERVDSLDTSLHGLPHRDTGDDTRGLGTHTSSKSDTTYHNTH